MNPGSDQERLAALRAFRPADIAGAAGAMVDLATLGAALGTPSRESPHLARDASRRDPDRVTWPCGCRAIRTAESTAAWRPCNGHVSRDLFELAAAYAYLLHLRALTCRHCGESSFASSPTNPKVSYVVDVDLQPLRLFGDIVPPPADQFLGVCACGAEIVVSLSAGDVAFVPLDLVPDTVRLTPFTPV